MQHCVGSPQQFCLRWNNYQSNLTNVFDQLLQSESFVDVTLACDGHSVKAHKMVLSACSPYFQSLFFENPCQHPIVILKDIRWPELKAAVEFMYKGEINVSQEQIGPLLKVAESLKIRGLADVNNDEVSGSSSSTSGTPGSGVGAGGGPGGGGPSGPGSGGGGSSSNSGGAGSGIATPTLDSKKNWEPRQGPTPQDLSLETAMTPSPSSQSHGRQKKRRRTSGERSSSSSPNDSMVEGLETSALELCSPPHAGGTPLQPPAPPSSAGSASSQPLSTHQTQVTAQGLPPPPQTHPHGPTLVPIPGDPGLMLPPMAHPDDMEIKPGIAEMIREEERAKLLESSHAWLGASTSSIAADSYQYQLQSMWQKCWNTNQSLVHNLRFRERGPLKSWRPETMAEAIFSVLKEGLSLSQAARKYDIPYPTFVLYANRVHNMLGPSADGGADLRPKGRGRPQRILLGSWPEEHIRGVIRTVVFRDSHQIKDEPAILGYPRLQEPLGLTYPGGSCSNGPEGTVSPGAAAAAAVAAVAQGLRQQMCSMVAAAQQHQHEMGGLGSLVVGGHCLPSNGSLRIPSPSDLQVASPDMDAAAVASPLAASPTQLTATAAAALSNVEVGIGVSGMTYKPTSSFTSPRPENLFQEDIEEIVKSPDSLGKDAAASAAAAKDPERITVKVEPSMIHGRND